jgi:hypothetical protein
MRGAGLSLEMWKIAKAERVPILEGSTWVIAMRDGIASPGSEGRITHEKRKKSTLGFVIAAHGDHEPAREVGARC